MTGAHTTTELPALVRTAVAPTLNSDVDWDVFDSVEYRDHNYLSVRDDDREIVRLIRDFFARSGVRNGRGVDVGPGANLYPSLAMLPFSRSLELRELSASNVTWLEQQKPGYDRNWDDFWAIYRENAAYAEVADPRARFRDLTTVRHGSVFRLPTARWDLGCMFFVACSLSTELAEFEKAVRRFVRALTKDAPFATAFMAQSKGYQVGDVWFPAVAIGADDVKQALSAVAHNVQVVEIETPNPLRHDVGMIVATGYATG